MTEQESFETALQNLQKSVETLESGELSLEESLRCFEAGVRHAARCQQLLKDVENRVELLLKQSDGNLEKAPFDQD